MGETKYKQLTTMETGKCYNSQSAVQTQPNAGRKDWRLLSWLTPEEGGKPSRLSRGARRVSQLAGGQRHSWLQVGLEVLQAGRVTEKGPSGLLAVPMGSREGLIQGRQCGEYI